MNFLAHIYLSGNSDGILIGNFIGDYVKGRNYNNYPPMVKKGILLHRNIDSFTDKHPITYQCRNLVNEKYSKYSGIVIDIFYDHYLAANWNLYSRQSLKKFIYGKYKILTRHFDIFPDGVKRFFPYFVKSNWLEAYSTFDGLESVLRRMSYRTSLPDYAEFALLKLSDNYEIVKRDFKTFFTEIISYVESNYSIKLGQ